jgi:hypothetical protein
MNTSKGILTSENALRIVLMIAAVIAIGSIGFFLAVLLENTTQAPATASSTAITVIKQKQDAMQSLAASEQTGSSTVIVAPVSTSSGSTANTPSASQSDPNDPNAAAKLRILESLNSQ